MATFTPGPWSYAIDDKDILVGIAPMARRYDAVAVVDYDDVDPDVAEANARLIAAAPELYKALEFARREIVHHLRGNEVLIESSVAIYGIDAALAKARGEQVSA